MSCRVRDTSLPPSLPTLAAPGDDEAKLCHSQRWLLLGIVCRQLVSKLQEALACERGPSPDYDMTQKNTLT